jgi:IS1 family transposase/lambda repressor-like predicted transcriptional regulator
MFSMNRLSRENRVQIIRALTEGCSLRSVSRMAGVSINTVTKLLVDVGRVCADYQDRALRGLTCKQIQCDEIWSFCYAKQKNVPPELNGVYGYGDVWTWTALDAETKLIVTWHVGLRTQDDARDFMLDLAGRVTNLTQLTTDGFAAYPEAVFNAFGTDVDYAQLIKIYRSDVPVDTKYSPATCCGAKKQHVIGCPDPAKISTSHVERNNLTMRMQMRRFTRLTNAFSKKVENLEHSVALHFMQYNFCRIHKTLRVTPAMAAGLTDRVWELDDIAALLETAEISN